MWRVEDGKQVATMDARDVQCFAVSQDGRWIAAGTGHGDIIVWDAETREQGFKYDDDHHHTVRSLHFSPDSTRLLSASSSATVSIWDVATHERVQTLRHDESAWMIAAKYSPQGDRIATATPDAIRVWDSNDGRLLLDIKLNVLGSFNSCLLWHNNHLLATSSDSKIKEFEASTGSAVSEWPVPYSNAFSCIARPKGGTSIAYSTKRTVTLWDTSTHTQLGHFQYPQDTRAIAVSPDDQFLAIGVEHGRIIVNSLSHVAVSIVFGWGFAYEHLSFSASHRIQYLCLVYTPHSTSQTFK